MELLIYKYMLTTSLITALLIIGIKKSMEDGYLLSKVREWAEIEADKSDLVRFILTPICLCTYCMSSVWTVIVQFQIGYTSLISLIGSVFLTLGMVVIIKSIIEKNEY